MVYWAARFVKNNISISRKSLIDSAADTEEIESKWLPVASTLALFVICEMKTSSENNISRARTKTSSSSTTWTPLIYYCITVCHNITQIRTKRHKSIRYKTPWAGLYNEIVDSTAISDFFFFSFLIEPAAILFSCFCVLLREKLDSIGTFGRKKNTISWFMSSLHVPVIWKVAIWKTPFCFDMHWTTAGQITD